MFVELWLYQVLIHIHECVNVTTAALRSETHYFQWPLCHNIFLLLQIKLCLTGSLPTDGYHLIRTSYNPTSKNLNYHFKMMKIVNIILYIKHVLALWCWQTLSAVITQHIYCIWARSRILCQTKKSTNKSNLPMFRFSKCHVITVNMCSVECWRIRINNPSCPLNTSISQSNFLTSAHLFVTFHVNHHNII